MKKAKLLTVLAAPLVIGAPLASVVSCSSINFTDTTYTEQNALIESQASKDLISSVWAKKTFANFYLRQVLKVEPTKLKSEAIYNFLEDLHTKASSVVFASKEPGLTTNDLVYQDIYQKAFESYKSYSAFNYEKDANFFTNKFNNLSTSSENPGWADIMAWEISSNGKLIVSDQSIGEKLFDTDTNQYYFIASPKTAKDKQWNKQFEADFKTLYRSQKTGVQKTVLEMMLTHLYFTVSNEQFVKGGTNYNAKYDGYPDKTKTIEAWKMSSFDIKSPTYFFENYLVDKNPVLKWKITRTDAAQLNSLGDLNNGLYDIANLDTLNSHIHNEGDKTLNSNLMFKTSDSTLNEILYSNNNLFGFDYSSMTSGIDSPPPDLNFEISNLINFNSEKSGFLDSYSTNEYRKNHLISFDQLKSMQLINKNPTQYSLPTITLVPEASTKSALAIKMSDIRINGYSLNSSKQWSDSKGNVFTLNSILPQLLSSNDEKNSVKLFFSAKFKNQDKSDAKNPEFSYDFDVDINWVLNKKINSDLNGEKLQSFDQFDINSKYNVSKGIQITKEPPGPTAPTEAGYSYYVRLLPVFNWNTEGSTVKIGEKSYPLGKFVLGKSLNMTSNKESTKKTIQTLSNYFYLQDADLFNTSVKQAFVWNNYSLESSDSTVNATLQSLSLKTLISSERKDKKLDKPFFIPTTTKTIATISRKEHLEVLNEQRK